MVWRTFLYEGLLEALGSAVIAPLKPRNYQGSTMPSSAEDLVAGQTGATFELWWAYIDIHVYIYVYIRAYTHICIYMNTFTFPKK